MQSGFTNRCRKSGSRAALGGVRNVPGGYSPMRYVINDGFSGICTCRLQARFCSMDFPMHMSPTILPLAGLSHCRRQSRRRVTRPLPASTRLSPNGVHLLPLTGIWTRSNPVPPRAGTSGRPPSGPGSRTGRSNRLALTLIRAASGTIANAESFDASNSSSGVQRTVSHLG